MSGAGRTSPRSTRHHSPSSRSPSCGTRRSSLSELLPGHLPKGRISPKGYVPPRPRVAQGSEPPSGYESLRGRDSSSRQAFSEHGSPRSPPSPNALPSPRGNVSPISHTSHGRSQDWLQPRINWSSPRRSPTGPARASPMLMPMESPTESPKESPIMTPQGWASPSSCGSVSPQQEREFLRSGSCSPVSRTSSRKHGASGRVSWEQALHERRAPDVHPKQRGTSVYEWLASRLPASARWRGPPQYRGRDAEGQVLDPRSLTSDISSPRSFWKITSTVSTTGVVAPGGAPTTEKHFVRTDVCTSLLVVALVVLSTSLVWLLFAGDRQVPQPLTPPRCTSDTCIKYSNLLLSTMDTDTRPCDDFYQYVCGTWVRTGQRPVYDLNWQRFLDAVAVRIGYTGLRANSDSLQPAWPGVENKAVTSILACLQPLARDNVQEVKDVLAAAGLPWPQRSSNLDVINALFYMALTVFQAVFVDITAVNGDGQRILLLTNDSLFDEVYNTITVHYTTLHIRSHFRTTYEAFSALHSATEADHERRQEELFRVLTVMKNSLDSRLRGTDTKQAEQWSGLASFLSLTPSVPESRWDANARRYLNGSLRSFTSVYLGSALRIRALFDLHREYGEENMTDFVGWFAVQALIPFTSPHLLESFYMSASTAAEVHRKDCVNAGYLAYAFALDYYLLQDAAAAIADVARLVELITKSFGRAIEEGHLVGSLLPQPNAVRLRGAFDILNASREAVVLHLYDDFPEMEPKQPLRNKMKLTPFLHNRQNMSTTYKALDATVFDGFRLNPQLLSFPWFAPDARLGVLLGGLGSRLAGTLYLDFAERHTDADSVYRENWRCLMPGSNNSDSEDRNDLVAASAAVHVILDAFQRETEATAGEKVFPRLQASTAVDVPPPYSEEGLLFAFHCWLSCGDERGRTMCNVPLSQSPHFARVFGCPPGTLMNPANRCHIAV